MSHSKPFTRPPRTGRRTRSGILAALVVLTATLTGVIGCQSLVASSSSASSHSVAVPFPEAGHDHRHRDDHRAPGKADGVLPDGVTVFDNSYPGVANLDPDLLAALRRASTDAADDGVEIVINTGWRSDTYQKQLLKEAIAKYGSESEAARWVATPKTSAHVAGEAVDIGPADAESWLAEHGPAYGLCQIYRNEPWHYELRTEAVDHGCPAMYADPTDDPRMHR